MATKTVGSGGDFPNMAAHAAYFNALTLTAPEYCNLLPGAEILDSATVTYNPVSGSSATNRLFIRPATGGGWRENANVRTNAVRYNPVNGAALNNSVQGAHGLQINCFATIEGVQIKGQFPLRCDGVVEARYNIIETNSTAIGAINIVSNNSIIEKNFLIQKGTGPGMQMNGAPSSLFGNTIVCLNATPGSVAVQLGGAYVPVCKNNLTYGFAADYSYTAGAGSSNNATSCGSFGGTGYDTAGHVGITSAVFQNVTSGTEDLRITATATALIDQGAAVGTSQDASGLAQPYGSAYDIGAWEYSPAAGGTTVPHLVTPTGTATGATSASASVATDTGGGTLYGLVSTNATETVATIEASSVHATVAATGAQALLFTGLTPSTPYYAHFVQVDASGNTSAVANSASFTTPALDSTAPVFAQGAAITPGTITQSILAFSYPAATDNVAVAGYQESKDGGTNWQDNGTGSSGQFSGLPPGTTYQIAVRAYDAQRNYSAPLMLSMTTAAATTGSFQTRPLANNTGTLWASGTAVAWQWHLGARVGSAATSITYGSSQVATDGTITATGLPVGSGYLLAAVLGANLTADKPFYQPGTAA